MSASHGEIRERPIRPIGNRNIAAGVVARVVRNGLTDPSPFRSRVFTNLWIDLKRYAARHVRNIELSRIRGIDGVRVDGPVRRHSPLIVTALSMLLECETVFEIGPDTGNTSGVLAHNLPNAQIFMLDEGPQPTRRTSQGHTGRLHYLSGDDRGARLDATPETSRITHLPGDSTTFDFVGHSGRVDLVYIEGSHRYPSVRSDTQAAFGLLSALGTIVWDGYSGDPGVYAYLNDLAPSLDRPIYHLLGTRLALYSRWDIVIPDV